MARDFATKEKNVYKEYELAGTWENPIELNKELIQRANHQYKKYNLDYKFSNNDLVFDFNEFIMEPARSTLKYSVKSSNRSK